MAQSGIDLTATMEDGKPQFNWLTSGNETASNSYNYVTNVVFVGLVHLPEWALDGTIAAQLRTDKKLLKPSCRHRVKLGELAYAIHQGGCRGAMRIVENDKAKATNVYYTYPTEELRKELEVVLPDAGWVTCRREANDKDSKEFRVALTTLDVLESLSEDTISSMKLKPLVRKYWNGVESDKAFETLFKRASQKVQELTSKWRKVGRSWKIVST